MCIPFDDPRADIELTSMMHALVPRSISSPRLSDISRSKVFSGRSRDNVVFFRSRMPFPAPALNFILAIVIFHCSPRGGVDMNNDEGDVWKFLLALFYVVFSIRFELSNERFGLFMDVPIFILNRYLSRLRWIIICFAVYDFLTFDRTGFLRISVRKRQLSRAQSRFVQIVVSNDPNLKI